MTTPTKTTTAKTTRARKVAAKKAAPVKATTPEQTGVTVVFDHLRDTKTTYVYAEREDADGNVVVGTLYVKKANMPNGPAPVVTATLIF